MLGSIIGAATSFLGSKGGQAMLGGLGNALGGVSNSATGYYMAKKMAQYNYDIQKKGYEEFPSAQVEGLKRAGINPMLAYNGITGATAHAQNYTPGSDSKLGSSIIEDYQRAKQNKLAEQNLTSQIEVNSANAEKARAEGEAVLMNAETNRLSVDKQFPSDPNNSGWGTYKALTSGIGSSVGALGGTALAVKGLYDLYSKWKGNNNNTVGQSKSQYIKPTNPKNTVIKPVTKPTTTSTPKSKPTIGINRSSATGMKAYAPFVMGELLDKYNKKYGFGAFKKQYKTHSNEVKSFSKKKLYWEQGK